MNAFGKPYRAQFLGGPQDGCHVEAEVPLGKKVATSGRPWDRSASGGSSGPAVGWVSTIGSVGVVGSNVRGQRDHLAEYWLEQADCCRQRTAAGGLSLQVPRPAELPARIEHDWPSARVTGVGGGKCSGWFGCQAVRLGRWLQTPVDYPLDMHGLGGNCWPARRVAPSQPAHFGKYTNRLCLTGMLATPVCRFSLALG